MMSLKMLICLVEIHIVVKLLYGSVYMGHIIFLPFSVPPERVSLLTQIFLGISLGVNISIAAFIMGRYSVNGDLLSFI